MREDLTQRRFIEETYRIISTEGREALSIRRLARGYALQQRQHLPILQGS